MSRMSVRTFLVTAKRSLQQAIKNQTPASFIIGNESADLDSITCALVYGYIQSSKVESKRTGKLYIPITNLSASDLSLRPELTALLQHADISPSELITLDDLSLGGEERENSPPFLPAEKTDWTLVDHNSLQGKLGDLYRHRIHAVIDHHEDENLIPHHPDISPRIITKSASCSSLVTNYLRETWQDLGSMVSSTIGSAQEDGRLVDDFAYASTWDAQVAKLALGPILIDSINIEATHKISEADTKAVRFLEAKIHISHKYGKSYSRETFYAELNEAKSNIEGMSLRDILRKDYKQWQEGDLKLGISSVVQSMQYLRERKEEDLRHVVQKWASERCLNVFAIMTAHHHGEDDDDDDDGFRRELVLYAFDDKGKTAAERFFQKGEGELQLEDAAGGESSSSDVSAQSKFVFERFWNQNNLEASRKRVGPLLRENMR
ncbi:DHH phosphoesterase [Sphaerulina musiva SO2202]|uniref:DHH phosphoesterase n=1 Tax=Sphaerulina musiva (strain SO2202) TaxID=692275 RepID=N1QHI2_SPHMS|nr:DHH phosphoesterase [Sphaerulina musiva SO2202]EMF11909.1 DHH phosphoesterase [Sphaerulina musiva SO2202]